jgi:DNA-binding HxlR family transcriptional regulator
VARALRDRASGPVEVPAEVPWEEPSVRPIVELLARRWVIGVLTVLWQGPVRRTQLCGRLGGVSDKVLTDTLRQLEAAGLIARRYYGGTPPRVEYGLTRRGRSLGRLLDAITRWSTVAPPVPAKG